MKNQVNLILASGSPRRRQLLSSLNVKFQAVSLGADESYDKNMTPEQISTHIAEKKAGLAAENYPDSAVIAADTIVWIDGNVLEKPKDEQDAYAMLAKLSGRQHEVYSGVCIMHKGVKDTFCEVTKVRFMELDDETIKWYISTEEPMDKAGAYAIQGYGAMLTEAIEGDFYNVMGFPVSKIMRRLKELGIYDIRND